MDEKSTERPSAGQESLTTSVLNLVDAALGVGTALARSAALATSGGKPISEAAPNTPAVSAIIHYGVAAAENVMSRLTRATAPEATKPDAGASARPRVRTGATLRVPLSIENRGERPMTGLAPYLRAVRRDGDETQEISAAAVSFVPAKLTVAPKDFEKLTVFIAIPENAMPGRFELVIALGAKEPDLPLLFDVIASQDTPAEP